MITITQGDALTLTLTCPDQDLTGASFATHFRTDTGTDLIIPNGQHSADPDQTTNKGKFTVTIQASDSIQMAPGTKLTFFTRVTQGSSIISYFGNKVLNVQTATLS